MELGLYTFGNLGPNPHTGERPSGTRGIADIVRAARLAEEAGLDVFGVGEHYRLDFAGTSPTVVLSAIAARTSRIRLTRAVTDPVRVFEDYATLDLVSAGCAETMAGRGAFVGSVPLFRYDLDRCDEIFVENYALLPELGAAERGRWTGRFRSPPARQRHRAPSASREMPVWIAIGGTLESAARAGALGGPVAARKGIADLYRRSAAPGAQGLNARKLAGRVR